MIVRFLSSPLYHRIKRRALHHTWILRLVILGIFIAAIILAGILIASPVTSVFKKLWQGPHLVSTFLGDPLYILPSYEGRTNILFLGLGGASHEGGDLTDTILFVGLDLQHTAVTMLSIPRDIWVPSLETKINAAYAIGEQQATGSGSRLIEDAVYEITNQPTHYIVKLDFDGFIHVIDAIGGVDVKVEKELLDTQYPIKGKEADMCDGDPEYRCRYETIHFQPGVNHMDGTTALKYVRSRHATGEEGTDFARAARQRLVIQAIRDKLISMQVLLNPKKIWDLKALADQYVIFEPRLTQEEYAAMASFGLRFWRSDKEVKTITFDTGDEETPGFLVNPPQDKFDQWVLEPRAGNWGEFQSYFKEILREQ